MEKVIIFNDISFLSDSAANKVNDLLLRGWTVKQVVTGANKDGVTAIFVLEKSDTPYIPPKK